MKKSLRELCTAIAICFCATGNLFATDNQFNTDHTMDKNLNAELRSGIKYSHRVTR